MPDNNIQWGQGAVNNRVGWGAGATNNTIGWGAIHIDSYAHDETNLVGGLGSLYSSDAIAEGGSGGDPFCADITFLALQNIETIGYAPADNYTQLAIASGGTDGSTFCAQKTFIELEKEPTENTADTTSTTADTNLITADNG